uniref:Cystatin n=1 Tax=Rhipicephalus appendiculatus TaxID=34631 RepID=A0A131YDV3_RHIAP
MAVVHASLLFFGLLVSFCGKSFEARGWTEVRHPNTPEYRELAQFAFVARKARNAEGITFLVTQARWKIARGTAYNIGFIVIEQNRCDARKEIPALTATHKLVEKCNTTVLVSQISRYANRRTVIKFWCRPVRH